MSRLLSAVLVALTAVSLTAQTPPTFRTGANYVRGDMYAMRDGQVVVTYDLVGLFDRFTPKFIKRYATVSTTIREAAAAYVSERPQRVEGALPGARFVQVPAVPFHSQVSPRPGFAPW